MTDLPPGVDPMRNFNVKLEDSLRDWLAREAARKGCNLSASLRHWLRLAYKYRQAIEEAEKAPARFVREVR